MNTTKMLAVKSIAIAAIFSLSACAGMNNQDKSAVAGAGIGAVGGAVLTGGSAIGTVGGAAVGGFLGNEVGKKKE
ncbi:prenyltransferase [Undibacterium sp.]|uniref:prenyltransferase n=1 Tax=Undibacterium sp. TaxID=1914977 RepID=UPI00374D7484